MLYHDDVFKLEGIGLGAWEDLTPYLAKEQIDDLVGLQQEYIKMNKGVFRIPWWSGMSMVYYRKDLFEKEGLKPPTTWAELLEVGKKLTKDLDGDGKLDQWGSLTQGTDGEMYNAFCEFLAQTGGDEWVLAPNGPPDPKALQALSFMREVIEKITPPDLTSFGNDAARAMFREGKVAMLRDRGDGGRAAVEGKYADKVGVMNFPAGPAGPYDVGHCWGIVVNKYGANFKANIDTSIDL